MKKEEIQLTIWEKAKGEIKAILIHRAKHRGMIAYSELTAQTSTIHFDLESADWRSLLAQMLGEISREEDAIGRGMLSALVVHKREDMQPGEGFFHLAKELGRDTTDKLTCWVREIHKIYVVWTREGK